MAAPRLVIITGDFHKELAEEMIAAASAEASVAGADIVATHRVAGSYEVPLITDAVLASTDVDAIIVLGYIERGETMHGEVMGYVVHEALMKLQLKYGKPIGIGLIGPGATPQQAEARKDGAARGAVRATVRSLALLKNL